MKILSRHGHFLDSITKINITTESKILLAERLGAGQSTCDGLTTYNSVFLRRLLLARQEDQSYRRKVAAG